MFFIEEVCSLDCCLDAGVSRLLILTKILVEHAVPCLYDFMHLAASSLLQAQAVFELMPVV